jgi:predicted nucleic acid-binding protein
MLAMPESLSGRPNLVLDTTVLSNFAMIGQVSLLEHLYRQHACTALMVADEIQRGLASGYAQLQTVLDILSPLQPAGWLPVLSLESAVEQALYMELIVSLDPGEAGCLALAIARKLTLASDDLAARRQAAQRGVPLTGTIGILIRLVREGYVPLATANRILAQMIALDYRSPVASLDTLI